MNYREIFDIPEIPWPKWEERFGQENRVITDYHNPKPLVPLKSDNCQHHEWVRGFDMYHCKHCTKTHRISRPEK